MQEDSESSVTRTRDAAAGDPGPVAAGVAGTADAVVAAVAADGAGTACRRRRGRITLIALLLLFSSPIALSSYT